VAFLLELLKQPWRPVFVDYMQGETNTESWRESNNEMGEVRCGYLMYPKEETGFDPEADFEHVHRWL